MSNKSVVTTTDVAEELRYFADRNIYDALVSQFLRKGIKTKRTERKYVLDHLIGYVGVDSGYAFYPDRETVSDRSEFPLAALNKLFGDIWEFSYSGIRNNFIVTLKQSFSEVVGYIDIYSSEGDNVLQLSMFGAEDFVNTLIERTSKTFEPKVTRQCTRFSLNAKGELGTAMISLANPKPYSEGVYVNVGLEPKELLVDWYASDSRCVLFWGPAGGGKSSFVSQMLVHRGYSNIVIIDDGDVMQSKELINAIRSLPDGTLVIFEDADILLSKREDGNRQMSGLLNIISGIAERDIRFMFLTNLTSLDREVDEALLRKGRMYKAVKFIAYKPKQVNTVRKALDLDLLGESVVNTYENWSLADIIHYGTADGVKHQGIGF